MVELPAWAEVDLSALSHNVTEICRVTGPGTELMAVVKANAYGHGAVEVSKAALASGASRLAVARTSEGVELRRAGIDVPILVLGFTPAGLIREVVEYGLEQTVYGPDYARMVDEQASVMGVKIPVHIKIDTGMGRIGVVAGSSAAEDEVKEIAVCQGLKCVGIFSHFAAADCVDKTYTSAQWDKFIQLLDRLSRQGLDFPLKHCANSAAILDFPQSRLNLVRAGIIMYGLFPSPEVSRNIIKLRPVMSFKTRVAQVKRVPPGFSISYGCTYTTERESVIATLPVGYADGYSRRLSSRGEVLIKERRVPVVGRVCMDQCMIDVGSVPGAAPGEEVVLFGRQGDRVLPVEELAGWIGTINYEVVCMVGARVPRIFTG